MEVERKFRLTDPPDLSGSESDPIEQGYLAVGAEGEVRLRRKGDRTLLTAKRGAGLSRGEAEVEISPEQFDRLWPLTEGRRLRKRRHVLPHDGVEIEVDVYEGDLEGLIVAEVEFDSEERARGFEPPAWLGDDVTGDERFLNENLAVNGVPGA
jgi:adenylate cyclase